MRKYQGLYSTPNTYAQVEPLTIFTTSRVFDPNSNNSGFRTDEYVQLIDQAGSEPDAAKRRQLYVALERPAARRVVLDDPDRIPAGAHAFNRQRRRLHAARSVLLHEYLALRLSAACAHATAC